MVGQKWHFVNKMFAQPYTHYIHSSFNSPLLSKFEPPVIVGSDRSKKLALVEIICWDIMVRLMFSINHYDITKHIYIKIRLEQIVCIYK